IDEDSDISDQFEDNVSNVGNKVTTETSDNEICSLNVYENSRSEGRTSFGAANACQSSRFDSLHYYDIAVQNLEALFPNVPVPELESIYKDSLDFEHALEVVLRRYDEKVSANHSETETVSRSEANSSVIQNINSPNTAGLELLGANTNDSDDEQVWDAPVSEAFFKDDDDASQCLKRFISGAVNPFGDELDLVLDRNKDILEQAVRKYKNSAFDVTRPLNVSFKQELGVDAGGLTREYFHLLMKRMRKQTAGSITLFEGSDGHL
ncbi:G2 M phase-specific E3 ubiquitin- ligase, partial [Paramuricea clavata]